MSKAQTERKQLVARIQDMDTNDHYNPELVELRLRLASMDGVSQWAAPFILDEGNKRAEFARRMREV